MEMATTNNLQSTFTTRTVNPGFIATRPIKPSALQSSKKTGLNVGIKKLDLESLEVIVGNGENLTPGVLKVRKGDIVYIKSDRYHQPWASEILKSKGLEETVDGKEVPIEFILVPIGEVVMVDSVTTTPDWSKYFQWPYNYYPPNYIPPYIGDLPQPQPQPLPCPNIWCGKDGDPRAEYLDGTGIPAGGLTSGDTTG
jgi:hypothetical protein